MRTSLGRCYPHRKLVRLNEILLLPENAGLVIEVACHEVVHVAAFELHGPTVGPMAWSGPRWWRCQVSPGAECGGGWPGAEATNGCGRKRKRAL